MSPEERVAAFASAMVEWELWYWKASRPNQLPDYSATLQLQEQARERLQKIFPTHLTEKGQSETRFGTRLGSLSVSKPPRYAQQVRLVEPGRKVDRVYVIAEGHMDTWYRYTVLAIDGHEPLIDDVRAQVGEHATKWNLKLY